MKRFFFVIIYSLFITAAFAQKDALTIDEHNKYIYYKVIDVPGITTDTLYNRCLAGLKQVYQHISVKPIAEEGKSIVLKATLVVYNNGSLARHEAGEFAYIFTVEFKNNKYRYWLTGFVFTPYQRNRYDIYERVPGVTIPMESIKAKYDEKTFDSYAEQILIFSKQKGDEIKLYTANPQKKSTTPAKTDTRNW